MTHQNQRTPGTHEVCDQCGDNVTYIFGNGGETNCGREACPLPFRSALEPHGIHSPDDNMKPARIPLDLARDVLAKRGTPDFATCALNNAEAIARALITHLADEYLARNRADPEQFWGDPTAGMLNNNPLFDAIWNVIKTWDVNVPHVYQGYCGATGNHARAIYDAVAKTTPPHPQPTPVGEWLPIATIPECDDLMWFCRGDTFQGPRVSWGDEADYWDWWCYAKPPPLPHPPAPQEGT